MQPEFSPPLTRLDAVLWFLRVQLGITVIAFLTSLPLSQLRFPSFLLRQLLTIDNLLTIGLPLLILAFLPRVLATAMLGNSEREPLSGLGLRTLLPRCMGIALFVSSLGRMLQIGMSASQMIVSRSTLGDGYYSNWGGLRGYYPEFPWSIVLTTAVPFVIGAALAFGPTLRENFTLR